MEWPVAGRSSTRGEQRSSLAHFAPPRYLLAASPELVISTDPEFGPKAADVVGLYLNPPEKALVIAVDQKPSIQALERAQGY